MFIIFYSSHAVADLSMHTVRKSSYWGDYPQKSIAEKLIEASPEVIDYLRHDNILNGWPNKPRPIALTQKIKTDLIQSLQEIPKSILDKVNKKLTSIIVVSDLGGSGFTENIFDEHGNPIAGFIVLDISVLGQNANLWATWKESSPFKADGKIIISAIIDNENNNNLQGAYRYILLHEFGHIVSIGLKSIAPWGVPINKLENIKEYEFTSLSWEIKDKKMMSVYDGPNFERSGLRYYGSEKQKLPSLKGLVLYQQLQKTNFPSLYAATNPQDDFAESFATYVHTVIMKRPWSIKLKSGINTSHEFSPCWLETRCLSKRKALEDIILKL